MPKITLTADEEIQYLRELDIIQEIIPELEIHIIPELQISRYAMTESSLGTEFRSFLQTRAEKRVDHTQK